VNLSLGAILIVAVFLTAMLSGVYEMVGGMMLLWVLLLLMPVSAAFAVQGCCSLSPMPHARGSHPRTSTGGSSAFR
jgi:hypothetical protein